MDVIFPPAEPPSEAVTLVTGLEGPVNAISPVTCGYCHLRIVADDDHAANCPWHPGKAPAR
ncbi:hypothetical protein E1265_24865 [Streptomyces sp. 8K308]|uniref:hypothetical protein n=1 Tax=Streptomyces sp. 8K308 TaxID=2530388 RepID=UPI001050E56C|nr:hypothetical protein [Streptomyces sp. 8K308]TDC18709.1 hypothetical protein E1265_24865 [Streptomyces sp. 8K308]